MDISMHNDFSSEEDDAFHTIHAEILKKRIDSAFSVALEKLVNTRDSVETVMQTGEAFGRGLFAEFLKDKTEDWTMDEWLDYTQSLIFQPLGSSMTTAEVAPDAARVLMTQGALQDQAEEAHVALLFTYAFIRGLLLSAFPNGELLMGSSLTLDDPVTEFTIKRSASYRDRYERHRVKSLFTTTKKL